MDGKAQLVATAGLGLVAVNYWTGNQRAALTATVWNKRDPATAHKALISLGSEVALVALLTFAGQASDQAAMASIAVLVALWILWAMKAVHPGQGTRKSLQPDSAPMQQSPRTQGA